MDPIGRFVMAGLAVFVAWTVFRALRSGTLYSEKMAFGLDENPIAFGLGIVVHAGLVVFCAAMAAGYPFPEFCTLICGKQICLGK